MRDVLDEPRFEFVSDADKGFVRAFSDAMRERGYDYGNAVGGGYCWGRYMLIYRRTGVKSQKVVARVYLREGGVALRLYLSKLDDHRAFLESAPAHIRAVLGPGHGDCHHCGNDHDGACKFRKTYTLDGRVIEKCNGVVFEFPGPTLDRLGDYMALFSEFNPTGRSRGRARA